MLSDREWHTKHKELCFNLSKSLNSSNPAKRAGAVPLAAKLVRAAQVQPEAVPAEENRSINVNAPEDPQTVAVQSTVNVNNIEDDDEDEEETIYENLRENEEEGVKETETVKTSASKIQSFIAIMTMLLQAPKLDHQITASYIKNQIFSSVTLKDEEAQAAASVANTLRPLVPHKPAKGEKAELSVFTLASFAMLTKRVLEAVHLSKQCWKLVPDSKDRITLLLDAISLNEVLGDEYILHGRQGMVVTSKHIANEHSDSVPVNLFNVNAIARILYKRDKVQPSNVLMYTNRFVIRWLGTESVVVEPKKKEPQEKAQSERKPADLKDQNKALTKEVSQLAKRQTVCNKNFVGAVVENIEHAANDNTKAELIREKDE